MPRISTVCRASTFAAYRILNPKQAPIVGAMQRLAEALIRGDEAFRGGLGWGSTWRNRLPDLEPHRMEPPRPRGLLNESATRVWECPEHWTPPRVAACFVSLPSRSRSPASSRRATRER
jgi:hypothetical protein